MILRHLLGKVFKRETEEEALFEKYRKKQRFVEENILFHDRILRVPDVVSFAYQIKEIFQNHIYKFSSNKKNPLIYDCGANIGVSILYFKSLYPESKIKAFEADERIFSVLQENVQGFSDIHLFHNAVWINGDELVFNAEGADGGSLKGSFDSQQKVKGVRLKELLEREEEVDFFKMDIEGAEIDVIEDCANSLGNIKNIFVEYHAFVGAEQKLDVMLKILRLGGFRYYVETINRPAQPFVETKVDGQMDLQVNIFGVHV